MSVRTILICYGVCMQYHNFYLQKIMHFKVDLIQIERNKDLEYIYQIDLHYRTIQQSKLVTSIEFCPFSVGVRFLVQTETKVGNIFSL